jgi:hypothetical protein
MINCENCRHYKITSGEVIAIFEWCERNRSPDVYSVTGKPIRGAVGTAWDARGKAGKCGPDGKWFEPKPRPWWKFWADTTTDKSDAIPERE